MNAETKETCKKLKELSENLKAKADADSFFSLSEEDYVELNIGINKPELKKIEAVEEPLKPSFTKRKGTLFLVIGFLLMLSPLFLVFIPGLLDILSNTAVIVAEILLPISFIIYGIILGSKYRKYEAELKKYNDITAQNKENEKENEIYPEHVRMYEDAVLKCRNTYKAKYLESKEILENAECEINKYNGIIAPKFYENIDEIVEIIEDGRADTLKEAINIFISDSRQMDLVKAQQEMNKIAERQLQDAQRHNIEMEEQAKQQTDAIKNQERARRMGAPSCTLCKNFPCGGNPAYCGSFAKKQ